ncbi:hypothetical protein C0J52_19988 [Blattella germanica]|nr:hypothetical protein C0J52_19988 [Blattella germanica]
MKRTENYSIFFYLLIKFVINVYITFNPCKTMGDTLLTQQTHSRPMLQHTTPSFIML